MSQSLAWKKRKYLQACSILERLHKRYNFCGIEIKDNNVSCYITRSTRLSSFKDNTLCCANFGSKCKFLGEHGCTTKNYLCKSYLCQGVFNVLTETNNTDNLLHYFKICVVLDKFISKHSIPFPDYFQSPNNTKTCNADYALEVQLRQNKNRLTYLIRDMKKGN